MKKFFCFLLSFLAVYSAYAQCGVPQSAIDLHANNIQARILNGGDLFTDFVSGQFLPNPDPNAPNNPSTIFAAGLWMGGIDPAGNLKIATVDYRNNGDGDYAAGPLSVDGVTDATTCANWDRHFTVNGSDVAAFLAALPLDPGTAINQYRGIMGWPGRGNPYFSQIWGFDLPFNSSSLAPFWDANGDAVYNPLAGDYPVVALRGMPFFVPAQIVWSVFNDQKGGGVHTNSNGQAIQAEVQQTAWAFNCPDQPLLNNTVFTSHKIINRASEPIDSFHVGLWVDFDLGCSLDDYTGCSPSQSAFYGYNADVFDGNGGSNCFGTPTFNAPPVQSVTFLGVNETGANLLDKFLAYTSGSFAVSGNPTDAAQFYYGLTGSWIDGAPLTQGGNGYGGTTPVDYIFPDNPSSPGGWSMCTANLALADVRAIGSQRIGRLLPGAVMEINAAWAVHNDPELPCGLGSTFSEIDQLIQLHASGYEGVCSPLTTAPVYPSDQLRLFPNPSNGETIIQYGNIPVQEIKIFDAWGKWLQTIAEPGLEQTTLRLQQLPAGVYNVQVYTDRGVMNKQLAIVR